MYSSRHGHSRLCLLKAPKAKLTPRLPSLQKSPRFLRDVDDIMRLLDVLPSDSWFASKSSGSSFAFARRPDDRPVPPISVADMRAHIAFLRAVHFLSTRDAFSSLYVDGTPLRAAVGDYLAWLVEVSVARSTRPGPSPGEILLTRAPTLPVAWCWHVHRLDPHAYVRDCASLTGVVPYPTTAGVGFGFDEGPDASSPQPDPNAGIAPASKLADKLVAAIGRHATFLWQVSGAAYNDDAFLLVAAKRYEEFVAMTVRAGGALMAPPLDIDLAWHTHMLRDSEYLRESARMRGPELGAMTHDNGDGMGAHGDTSRLEAPWAKTLAAYCETVDSPETDKATMMKSAFEAAVPRGARHRGYAPAWWFARGESVVVVDDFLSPEECEAIVSQMPGPESAMNCPSGKKAQMYVDGDASVETRIRAAVSVGLGFAGEPEASKSSLVLEDIVNHETGIGGTRYDQFDPHRSLTVERTTPTVKLPARVSVGTMHPHRDRLAIYTLEGETMFEDDTLTADGYTCVVYLKADGGTLVLEPDETPGSGDASWTPPSANLTRREIDVRPGRLVAWPNHAFKHCAGRSDVVEGKNAVAESRWLLGPFHFTPGRARLPQVGDCGGGGSGDGGSRLPTPPPSFRVSQIWPEMANMWPPQPPEAMRMSRADDTHPASDVLSRIVPRPGILQSHITRRFRADLGTGGKTPAVPLSEPYKYVCFPCLCCFPPCLVTGQRFLESYEIAITHDHHRYIKYLENAVHNEGETYWWIIPGFPGACFPYLLSAFERRRVGEFHDTALVGFAQEPEATKSMVRFELIEANEEELRYARVGKDATVAYMLAWDNWKMGCDMSDYELQEMLQNHKAQSCIWNGINDDGRIRDFTGEMIIRDGEIVLTESYDGRAPYTITLKEVSD